MNNNNDQDNNNNQNTGNGNNNQMYCVVVNHEEQYSVWNNDTAPPAGWRVEGFIGPRDQCLGHIANVWTDMRPRSVREHADAASV